MDISIPYCEKKTEKKRKEKKKKTNKNQQIIAGANSILLLTDFHGGIEVFPIGQGKAAGTFCCDTCRVVSLPLR